MSEENICLVCDYKGNNIHLKCCRQNICRDCLILTGSFNCPHCRSDIKPFISRRLKDSIQTISYKDSKIDILEREVAILRHELKRSQSMNMSNVIISAILLHDIETSEDSSTNEHSHPEEPSDIPPPLEDVD